MVKNWTNRMRNPIHTSVLELAFCCRKRNSSNM